MQVIATKQGHDGLKVREPGEEFSMPDGSKGSWFVPAGEESAPPEVKLAKTGKAAKQAGAPPEAKAHGEVVPPDPPAAD